MSNKLHFQGTLQETPIVDLLSTIVRNQLPGVVQVSRDGLQKKLFIHEGHVLHAASTDRSDRLGSLLYRSGTLSRQQLTETMQERDRSGKLYGQVLIERELLSPAEVYQSIRDQMEAIVWSVFAWQTGDLSFHIGEFAEQHLVMMHLPVRQVIVRGLRQHADTKSLVHRMGEKSTIFYPGFRTDDLIEISLDQEEYALLRMINGRRNFLDLCNDGPLGVSENARLIYAFFVLGLISKDKAPESKPAPETPPPAPARRTPSTGGIKIKMDATGKIT